MKKRKKKAGGKGFDENDVYVQPSGHPLVAVTKGFREEPQEYYQAGSLLSRW